MQGIESIYVSSFAHQILVKVFFLKTKLNLTLEVPNTALAKFANPVYPDQMAHNKQSYLNQQCLPSSLLIFNIT